MIRIQLHIDERQDRALRVLARESSTTRAELIRMAIDRLLAEGAKSGDPLLDLIGAAGPAGMSDAGDRHDELLYVAEPGASGYGEEP